MDNDNIVKILNDCFVEASIEMCDNNPLINVIDFNEEDWCNRMKTDNHKLIEISFTKEIYDDGLYKKFTKPAYQTRHQKLIQFLNKCHHTPIPVKCFNDPRKVYTLIFNAFKQLREFYYALGGLEIMIKTPMKIGIEVDIEDDLVKFYTTAVIKLNGKNDLNHLFTSDLDHLEYLIQKNKKRYLQSR